MDEPVERVYEITQDNVPARRRELVYRIEEVLNELVVSIAHNQTPQIVYDDGKNSGWFNSSSMQWSTEGEHSTGATTCSPHLRTLKFTGFNSRRRFAVVMKVMSYAHEKLVRSANRLSNDFYCTKRGFYYTLKNDDIKRFVDKQARVEWAINQVTMILECGPWEIGFISTSKGLVAGDLTLHLGESKVMNYELNMCHAVPDVVASVTRIRTGAEFVLVVEKDSVFQQLLAENCPAINKCILVTGKGYPDIPTRMLVRLLSERSELPVYALVDANPHGFEIMCVYRFGTLNNLGYREQLLCPKMRWLGVHQNDLSKLGIPRVKLTKGDLKKIAELLDRNYMDDNFSKQLLMMRKGKAEIESVNTRIKRYLTTIFIPTKIQDKEYI